MCCYVGVGVGGVGWGVGCCMFVRLQKQKHSTGFITYCELWFGKVNFDIQENLGIRQCYANSILINKQYYSTKTGRYTGKLINYQDIDNLISKIKQYSGSTLDCRSTGHAIEPAAWA